MEETYDGRNAVGKPKLIRKRPRTRLINWDEFGKYVGYKIGYRKVKEVTFKWGGYVDHSTLSKIIKKGQPCALDKFLFICYELKIDPWLFYNHDKTYE
jgi:hypothetical protein